MNQKDNSHLGKQWVKIVIASCIIVFLCSTLFFANFGMVSAKQSTQNSLQRFSVNDADGIIKQTLYLYIEPDSSYYNEVTSLLQKRLEPYPFSIQLTDMKNKTITSENASFLGLQISEVTNQYYPWSGQNKYSVFYYFSDVANTMYFSSALTAESKQDRPAIVFNASQGSQVMYIGDILIETTMNGFFSKPRMEQMSIDTIVEVIYNQLLC